MKRLLKQFIAVILALTMLMCMVALLTGCNDTVNGKEIKEASRFVEVEGYEYFFMSNSHWLFKDVVTGIAYLYSGHTLTPIYDKDGLPMTVDEFLSQEKERLR